MAVEGNAAWRQLSDTCRYREQWYQSLCDLYHELGIHYTELKVVHRSTRCQDCDRPIRKGFKYCQHHYLSHKNHDPFWLLDA